MSHRRRHLAVLALLVGLLGGCAGLDLDVDRLRTGAVEATEQVRFCVSLARAVSTLDDVAPQTAAGTAEELLARVPASLRDDAQVVAEALHAAVDGDTSALEDPVVRAAAERLWEGTREICLPG